MNYPIKFIGTAEGFMRYCFIIIAACLLNLASCTGPTGPQGPKGNDGTDGTNGTNGTNGLNGVQVYVLSGTLTAGSMNVGGWWDIYNPYNTTAPLSIVYVRQSSATNWWTPLYCTLANGNFRILNNQSGNEWGTLYPTISGFEYRILVAQ